MITPDGTKNTSRRRDLRLEVGPLSGGEISNWRWHLWLEVGPPIGGDTSDWRWDLQLEVPPPIGGDILIRGGTYNGKWDLQLEVPPLIGGDTSDWRWDLQLEAPMLHVGISYSFEKKKRLFIVDYIKPSPVYQVKCKLVYSLFTNLIRYLYIILMYIVRYNCAFSIECSLSLYIFLIWP